LQEKNKDSINKLDERIKSLENNLAVNKHDKTNTSHKEYSNGIRTFFELVIGFLIGGFIGYYLDLMLSTSPIFLLLGIFIGGISGIYTIWKKNIYEYSKK
jgi:F0F1-type ATP synthase assembly protein I